MDLAQALRQLWSRKLWLLPGIAVAAAVAALTVFNISTGLPPNFDKKSIEFGTATTKVLVDAPKSPLANLTRDFGPLSARAAVYSRLIDSASVKRLIGARIGVPGEAIITDGPPPAGGQSRGRETNAISRGNELLGEGDVFRLLTTAGEDSPIINISAQAPTAEGAVALADATATGLEQYVRRLESEQKVDETQRVELRQLGDARGGLVNEGADKQMAVLAFLGILGLWCLGILVVDHLRRSLREGPQPSGPAAGSNGAGTPFAGEGGEWPATRERLHT